MGQQSIRLLDLAFGGKSRVLGNGYLVLSVGYWVLGIG